MVVLISVQVSQKLPLLFTPNSQPLLPWHTIALVQSPEAHSEVVYFGVTIAAFNVQLTV